MQILGKVIISYSYTNLVKFKGVVADNIKLFVIIVNNIILLLILNKSILLSTNSRFAKKIVK